MFHCIRNMQVTFVEKPQVKIISFQNCKHKYLIHTWSDKGFKVIKWIRHCHLCIEGHIKLRLQARKGWIITCKRIRFSCFLRTIDQVKYVPGLDPLLSHSNSYFLKKTVLYFVWVGLSQNNAVTTEPIESTCFVIVKYFALIHTGIGPLSSGILP